jgi:hypothetical protein
MSITNRDELLNALGNSSYLFPFNKSSIANQTVGAFTSLWLATGSPGPGAAPTTAAVASSATLGSIPFTDPVAPIRTYLGRSHGFTSTANSEIQLHDRLAHMGGLSGTSLAAQTVDVDVSVSTSNMVARKGASNYSEVQWWLEWYSDTGATASNATVAVTYDDASTGDLAVVAVGGTVRASRMLPLLSAVSGRYIKSIQSVTLSASTGTAGNFGVTATRYLGSTTLGVANFAQIFDWAQHGLPRIHDSACLSLALVAGAATTGVMQGSVKLVQG